MTPNSVLLDSSVVICHFRDANAVADKLAAYEDPYLPIPALAELSYGAYRSDRPQQHLSQITRFIAAASILTPDQDTSQHYGQIAAHLARKGTPIPQNDIWMAALAIQCRLPLATTDQHFQQVEGLTLLLW